MKQKNWQILTARFNDDSNEIKNNLAKFLKRRRLELKITLDDLSQGVCSTSYLSKIENGQVDVDELYYTLLFDKLDLDYEEVKTTRSSGIYEQLLKYYLFEKDQEFTLKIEELMNKNYYCNVEIEIMVLLYNVIKGSLQEAQILMDKLVAIQASLTKDDLKMLFVAMVIYYHKTSQYQKAFAQGQSLAEFINDQGAYGFAIADLLLDLYFEMNKTALFWKTFNRINNHPLAQVLNKRILRHQFQSVYLLTIDDGNRINEYEGLVEISGSDPQLYQEYYYYGALLYFKKGYYDQAINYLDKCQIGQRILVLKALIIICNPDFLHYQSFIEQSKETEFDSPISQCIIDYAYMKINQEGSSKLFLFIRNIIFGVLVNDLNEIFYPVFVNELLRLAFELGKYKETVKQLSKHKRIK